MTESSRTDSAPHDFTEYVDRATSDMLEVLNELSRKKFDRYCQVERDDDSLGALALGINMMVSDLGEAFTEARQARARAETILESIPDPTVVVNARLGITDMNQAAADLCGRSMAEARGLPYREVFGVLASDDDCPVRRAIDTHEPVRAFETSVTRADGETVPVVVSTAAFHDGSRQVAGAIEIFRDVTADRARERRLQEANEELAVQMRTIERQQRSIMELSTPILEIWDDVLALPLIGVIDTRRAVDIMERLLETIVKTQTRFVLLDLTGVEVVDTKTADHLIKLVGAARLLGAKCLLTGIQPAVAQTLVDLGVEVSSITTTLNLREGLRRCLEEMERRPRNGDHGGNQR